MANKQKKSTLPSEDGTKLIQRNKKAFHEYEILEKLECGMALKGTEVKSLRDGNVSFVDCYAVIRENELRLIGLNIAQYPMGTHENHEPTRTRKLLAHKKQIRKLRSAVDEKGLTLIPLRLFWRRGLAKVEIALARGKAQYDKRESIKKREDARQKQRILRRAR